MPQNPIITDADFRRALKGRLTGGYLFFGDEDYMKAAALRMAREAVTASDPAMAAFNDVRIDGGVGFSAGSLLDAMTVPPMGAAEEEGCKIITVTGLDLDGMRAADLDKLREALEAIPDYPYNLVILSASADALDAGNLPKRPSELLKTLSEYLIPVHFERNTPAKLAGWVQKHYAAEGVAASPDMCRFTIEYCGRQMFTLASEIDKVSFFVRAHGRDTVTEADVRAAATAAVEYDAFAFTNAISSGRRADALAILADLKLRRVEPLFVLGEVSRVVSNLYAVRTLADGGRTPAEIGAAMGGMHEYAVGLLLKEARRLEPERLRRMLAVTAEADLSLKRSAADGYGVIERIICGM